MLERLFAGRIPPRKSLLAEGERECKHKSTLRLIPPVDDDVRLQSGRHKGRILLKKSICQSRIVNITWLERPVARNASGKPGLQADNIGFSDPELFALLHIYNQGDAAVGFINLGIRHRGEVDVSPCTIETAQGIQTNAHLVGVKNIA